VFFIAGGKQVGFGPACFIISSQLFKKHFGKQSTALLAAFALFDFDLRFTICGFQQSPCRVGIAHPTIKKFCNVRVN
jgi:hypothetical protein